MIENIDKSQILIGNLNITKNNQLVSSSLLSVFAEQGDCKEYFLFFVLGYYNA